MPLCEKYVITRTHSAEKKLKDGETYLYSAKKIKTGFRNYKRRSKRITQSYKNK